MNFNRVFAPTAAAERLINRAHALDVAFTERHVTPHLLNARTYAQVVAVVVLTGISAAIAFASRHVNRLPEYRIRLQLAKVRSQRWFVRGAIAFASFTSYHGFDSKIFKARELWRNKGAIARTVIDAAFCLN